MRCEISELKLLILFDLVAAMGAEMAGGREGGEFHIVHDKRLTVLPSPSDARTIRGRR